MLVWMLRLRLRLKVLLLVGGRVSLQVTAKGYLHDFGALRGRLNVAFRRNRLRMLDSEPLLL